jgi:hypothetical protein
MKRQEQATPVPFQRRPPRTPLLGPFVALIGSVFLSACRSNTTTMVLPLAPPQIEEFRSTAGGRSGVIRWRAPAGASTRVELGSITADSLRYTEEDGQELLWSSLADVSRVELPTSWTRSVVLGAAGGAVAGTVGVLGSAVLLWAACNGGTACSVDWGGAARAGAFYGSIVGAVLGILVNGLDPEAFEFMPGG